METNQGETNHGVNVNVKIYLCNKLSTTTKTARVSNSSMHIKNEHIKAFEPDNDDDEEAVALRQADPNAEPTSGRRTTNSEKFNC